MEKVGLRPWCGQPRIENGKRTEQNFVTRMNVLIGLSAAIVSIVVDKKWID